MSFGGILTNISIFNDLLCRLAAILDLKYCNGYLYRQNNMTNEFLDLNFVEKRY